MQISNAPKKLVLPFASSGARNDIPTASQVSTSPGAASLVDGFPPLTRTPLSAGGVPPSGLDMNGILYELSAVSRWANAGAGFAYDSTFSNDTNIGGYPKGARVMRSDGIGYWLNTVDNNTTDPESVTVGQAASAGWVPDVTNGVALVSMTSSDVTLSPLSYGKPIIVLSGALVANLNLIFPSIVGEWAVINNCTGAFNVTCKTASGTGVSVPPGARRLIYCDATNVDAVSANSNSNNIESFGASANLSIADANKIITASVNGVTLTLPAVSSVPPGTMYSFVNGNASMTLACLGLDRFDDTSASIVFGALDTLVVVAAGSGIWWPLSGSLALKSSASFAASLSSSGYQKLPGGFILQWGSWLSNATPGNTVAVSFPIVFPNNCLRIVPGANNASSTTSSAWYDTPTVSGFNGRCNIASIGCSYIAIGN